MAENTREIILDTLLALEREEEFSNKLIKAVLDKYDYLDGKEKAFIKRVTEGTIERQIELDYYLDHFSSVPVRKMKPLIRCLMRMSVYQLLFMDAVPDSAVCNEACKLAMKRKFVNLKGFVNGVLRSIARSKDALPLPDKKDRINYLHVKYSMPKWLVEYWTEMYGAEGTENMLEGLLKIHPVSLRFRTDRWAQESQMVPGLNGKSGETDGKESREAWWHQCARAITEAGVTLRKSPLLPYVFYAENVENVASLPGYEEGAFTVQDVSSAMAVEAAGIKAGDFVMDVCAAPGGKSLLAAEMVRCGKGAASSGTVESNIADAEDGERDGRVLSRDVSDNKVALIEENIARMGADNIETQVHDATVYDSTYAGKADVVLMDVPCSGLGVMGKKRDIKYHVTPQSLSEIVELQKQIVESCWQYVKPGGVLLYSTCTVNPKENEEMTGWITGNFPFVLEEQKQLFPGKDECDGFFYARLRRMR